MDRQLKRRSGLEMRRTSAAVLLILLCSSALSGGAAVGAPNHSNQSMSCSEEEFPHDGYCCNKCLPGFKMVKSCDRPRHRTQCQPCAEGTYLALPNYSTTCYKCRKCDTDETELSPCSSNKNRVCGCLHDHYRTEIAFKEFECRPCRVCPKGFIQTQACSLDNDTQCACGPSFYQEGTTGDCLLCTKCNSYKECSHLCRTTPDVTELHKPAPDNTGSQMLTVYVLSTFLVLLMGILVIFLSKTLSKMWKKRRSKTALKSGIHTTTPTKLLSTPPSSPSPGLSDCELPLYPMMAQTAIPTHSQLPDCVPRSTTLSQFLYALIDQVPALRWKELVRRLGVDEREIERAERDQRSFVDAQYCMVRAWSEGGGGREWASASLALPRSLATTLLRTLRDMGLGGAAERLAEQYGIREV
ncbi:tumor necrosis factor receptor superfamily member 1A [Amia ocellicauda]|uniref:tumor necrosis factor receptor superfamily member 1A n=1 Tax=Amia ocellicauda TaxID=2972642 RepID=UPI003463F3BB